MCAGAGAAAEPNVGWEESFSAGDAVTIPGTQVKVENGVAHYVKTGEGWIHGIVFELPQPVKTADFPYFMIRAKDVRGRLFVQFKRDGAWPEHLDWTISAWSPRDFAASVVDLRKLGREVSAVWLNSDSSIPGAEWYIDWMRIVRDPEPLRVTITNPGALSAFPRRRVLRATVANRTAQAAEATAVVLIAGSEGGRHALSLKPGQHADITQSFESEADAEVRVQVLEPSGELITEGEARVPPLLSLAMLAPHYKNTMYATQKVEEAVVEAHLNVEPALLEGLTIRTDVTSANQSVPGYPLSIGPRSTEFRLSIPTAQIAVGAYQITVTAKRGAEEVAVGRLPLRRVGPSPIETRLREDGALLIDGQPFFPIGFYDIPTSDFEMAGKAGFNTVSFSGGGTEVIPRLDEANRCGMKVVIHSTWSWFSKRLDDLERTISPIQSHPAILAWYLRDEPSTSQEGAGPDDMRALYQHMHEIDPYHPSFTTLCVPAEYGLYADTTDLFAIDPYPVGCAPLTLVSDCCDRARAAMDDRRALWVIPQAFGSEKGPQTWWRIPTIEEEHAMTYLALIHGAKGIIYYRYDVQEYVPETKGWKSISTLPQTHPDLWRGFVSLGQELRDLSPVILSPEPAADRAKLAPPPLHAALRDCAGRRYLLVVNPTTEAVRARLAIPGVGARTTAAVWHGQETQLLQGGAFETMLGPLEARVYEARLPSQ